MDGRRFTLFTNILWLYNASCATPSVYFSQLYHFFPACKSRLLVLQRWKRTNICFYITLTHPLDKVEAKFSFFFSLYVSALLYLSLLNPSVLPNSQRFSSCCSFHFNKMVCFEEGEQNCNHYQINQRSLVHVWSTDIEHMNPWPMDLNRLP